MRPLLVFFNVCNFHVSMCFVVYMLPVIYFWNPCIGITGVFWLQENMRDAWKNTDNEKKFELQMTHMKSLTIQFLFANFQPLVGKRLLE